ncbi:hypothetical protein [Hymenobacter sp. GOD-10R]|uniref:hypothetical protein n=1 Tax=Hymenobacter sp. GOD-10R TaxID=3093922 RepID=UPI002D7856EC|nr:hypothetical protein [Hymenobacter sp. GOD-10R]WRQ31799.1 hypothetical protein SD425_28540 [Hymenobacter sp. GOD-10R]
MRLKLFYLLLGLHFTRIVLAVSHLDTLLPDGTFLELLDYTSALNKSNWTFGYFGHGIETNAKLTFLIPARGGTINSVNSDAGVALLSNAGDNAIRFYGFKARYCNVAWNPIVHDLYAKSMGLYLLNRYRARKVEIRTERCVTADLDHARAQASNVACTSVDSKIVEFK